MKKIERDYRTIVVVGGPHDGQRHLIDVTLPHFELIVKKFLPLPAPGDYVPEAITIEKHLYVREFLSTASEPRFCIFYRSHAIDIEYALSALFAGYKPY